METASREGPDRATRALRNHRLGRLCLQSASTDSSCESSRDTGIYAGSYTFDAGSNHVLFDYDPVQLTVLPRATNPGKKWLASECR
jgi:hypothetical protein